MTPLQNYKELEPIPLFKVTAKLAGFLEGA
jgi:hypothetical protein